MQKFLATIITAIIGITMIFDIGLEGKVPRLGLVFRNSNDSHCGVIRDSRMNQATWFGSNGVTFTTQASEANPNITNQQNVIGIIIDPGFYEFLVRELDRLHKLEEYLKKQKSNRGM